MSLVWSWSGEDGTLGAFDATGGTVTNTGDVAHIGTRSVVLDTTAGSVTATADVADVLTDAGCTVSCWVRWATLPDSRTTFLRLSDAASAAVIEVFIDTDGTLSLTPAGTSVTTLTGSAVSLNTWYFVSVSYQIVSTTDFDISFSIDGQSVGTTSDTGTLTRTASNLLKLRCAGGASKVVYFDSIWVETGYRSIATVRNGLPKVGGPVGTGWWPRAGWM